MTASAVATGAGSPSSPDDVRDLARSLYVWWHDAGRPTWGGMTVALTEELLLEGCSATEAAANLEAINGPLGRRLAELALAAHSGS